MEESTPKELTERQIVRVIADAPGWFVEYDCGHGAWWAIEPTITATVCAQCVLAWMDVNRKAIK